ncbi:alanine--tRNA ligase, mitochondrial [Pristis pectinata]|uniref:alanine--tRNA ligase, mitochondrial n=1 Tax=Pristis pectinata TaxID=685728 RepID=UPI00223CB869|nr:alanine--tRNA ligase, mitochondrial [Pristis pectinata]
MAAPVRLLSALRARGFRPPGGGGPARGSPAAGGGGPARGSPAAGGGGPSARSVRRSFLRFFRERQRHREVRSAPVTPRADPSLLFVNAGMNQFKPLILGSVDPRSEMAGYQRVVNSQKCLRAGGKHNDLDDVGRDLHHHTFFEMLGNWSFGDFFKEEACSMAWELLTDVYGIPRDRLYVTYFGGDAVAGLAADEETRDVWLSLGLPPDRVLPFGLSSNFWEMGETGPCGPCTEIHYDHGLGQGAAAQVNTGNPAVVELWNLVFMQYHREVDSSLQPLPQHSVDTGMGLERLVAVLQGTTSNYDTDLFAPILDAIHRGSGAPRYGGLVGSSEAAYVDMAYRVLADHARALTVCIADGLYPGMSGAPLVLRRILRRALRFSTEVLRAPAGLLAALVPSVVETLGDAYPELKHDVTQIMDVISEGEADFLSSLHRGRRVIDRTLDKMAAGQSFPADVAWSLHRSLGFPLDLIGLMLGEKSVTMDTEGLDRLAREEAERSRGPQPTDTKAEPALDLRTLQQLHRAGVPPTDDSPKYSYSLDPRGQYAFPRCRAAVLALILGRRLVQEVGPGQRCCVVLDRTNFYSEQGGQSPDCGFLTRDGQQDVLLPVLDVQAVGGFVVHTVSVPESLCVGDQLELFVDEAQRLSCMVKHTATHLLNAALRRVLGPQTEQRGSHVAADRLRLDISIKGPITDPQLGEVEAAVGELIRRDEEVFTAELPLSQALEIPGLRTVDEIYPDPVRVVSVGTPVEQLQSSDHTRYTSVELCCGTHLFRTGLIQDLAIVSERQLGKGMSRLIALTGQEAKQARVTGSALCEEVDSLSARTRAATTSLTDARRLGKDIGRLTDVVDGATMPQRERRQFQHQLRALQRAANTRVRKLEEREAADCLRVLLAQSPDRSLVVDTVPEQPISVLGKMVKLLSAGSPSCSVMLLSPQPGGKVLCVCRVPQDLRSTLSAVDWALAVCAGMGGSAGGTDLVAKGTGSSSDLEEVIQRAERYARSRM